jgi:hypothetical protein
MEAVSTSDTSLFWSTSMGWDYVSELLPLTGMFIPQMIQVGERRWYDGERDGETVETVGYWQGKTEEHGEKLVPVPLCTPQIPHGLTRARTRASAVRGRRLFPETWHGRHVSVLLYSPSWEPEISHSQNTSTYATCHYLGITVTSVYIRNLLCATSLRRGADLNDLPRTTDRTDDDWDAIIKELLHLLCYTRISLSGGNLQDQRQRLK